MPNTVNIRIEDLGKVKSFALKAYGPLISSPTSTQRSDDTIYEWDNPFYGVDVEQYVSTARTALLVFKHIKK